jgi:hypothetical protein
METTRYTFTCRVCVASGPKDRRRPKTEKQCIYCKGIKPASEFHSHNYTTRTGKNSRRLMSGCKECCSKYARVRRVEKKDEIREQSRQYRERNKLQIVERDKAYYEFNKERMDAYQRKHHLRTKYGITPAQHAQMILAQDGKCLVCGETPDGRPKKGKLHVDHCHDTGKVRGLLCHSCNVAIGHLKEDPVRIKALLEYVLKHLPV